MTESEYFYPYLPFDDCRVEERGNLLLITSPNPNVLAVSAGVIEEVGRDLVRVRHQFVTSILTNLTPTVHAGLWVTAGVRVGVSARITLQIEEGGTPLMPLRYLAAKRAYRVTP